MLLQTLNEVPGLTRPTLPLSHAVIANGFVFTSGQLPLGQSGAMPEQLEAQIDQVLTNLRAVLQAAGSDLDLVVKVNGYLTDPRQLDAYNRVYRRHFGEHAPARTTVCVSLQGIALEIDCIAVLRDAKA